jgi:hypothetical protein
MRLGKDIASLGYIPRPADEKSIATFRLLDNGGVEHWKYLQEGDRWDFGITMFKTRKGYLLISSERDFSPGSKETKLRFTMVSTLGAVLMERQHSIPIHANHFTAKDIVLDNKGNLLIAVPGDVPFSPSMQQKRWINPVTGSKKFCVNNEATMILRIDLESLQIISQKLVPDTRIVSLRHSDNGLYAAATFSTNCHVEKQSRLAGIDVETLEVHDLFHTNNVNGIDVTDFALTEEGFVLVGRIETLLPSALTKDIMTPEQLNALSHPNPWDPSIWEQREERASAFALLINRDGSTVADRIYSDVRHRSLCCIMAVDSNRFVTVGNAFGDPAWAMIFSIRRSPSSVPAFKKQH